MRLVFRILLIAVSISLSPAAVFAEENESGHYFPGALSSFVDMLPNRGVLTLGYLNESTYYNGSGNLELPGGVVASVHGTSYVDTSVFLFQAPPIKLNGQNLGQYAVALAVPYESLSVRTSFSHKGMRIAASIKDTDSGFGDIVMFPMMMGWAKSEATYSLKGQAEFGIYAPTGNFSKDPGSANIGRNYWTFEPSAATSYFFAPRDGKYSLEFTTSVGFDFNTKNGATHYQTGDQFHLDGTLAVHRSLFGGFAGAGVSGFFYQQTTKDSGSGAAFGSFEAMTTGVGPVLSYAGNIGNFVIGGEVKWLPEFSTSNRLSGNIVWFKLAMSWGAQVKAAAAPAAPNLRALQVIPSL
jgi:hypothetical protein